MVGWSLAVSIVLLFDGKLVPGCVYYFVDLEIAFDSVLRKVLDWSMRKKGIPEASVRSVMSLYEGAKTRVMVECELSEEFEVIEECTKHLCCHLFYLKL